MRNARKAIEQIKSIGKAYGILFTGIYHFISSDLLARWNLINFQKESLSLFSVSSRDVFAVCIIGVPYERKFYIKNKSTLHWNKTSSLRHFRKFLSDKGNTIFRICRRRTKSRRLAVSKFSQFSHRKILFHLIFTL